MNNTTASIRGGRLLARAALCAELLASVLTLHAGPPAKPASGELVVHEWGTFTSLQAANGNPIAWHPFASSQLPGFVYDWTKPGLTRVSTTELRSFSKAGLSTLERMETPVVYFYSDREQTVDLSVRFPGGLITEWYPQATQIGPSKLSTNSEGAQPAVTADSSIIRWPNVHVLANGGQSSSPNLAQDQSGSHYFTARQTDANIVEVQTGADNQVEREKFLFYRGVANFEAPLHVALDQSEAATLENRSGNPLADLFLLRVKDGRGQFVHVKKLGSGETRTVSVDLDHNGQLLAELDQRLGDEMARALVGQGLFEREAAAMVATWKDSWFEEPGIRVLYLLPRPWTDTVLPMKMTPVPTHLERVMVGRAELVPPGVEEELAKLVKQASKDPAANNRVQQIERELGRFAGPIVERASGSSYYE